MPAAIPNSAMGTRRADAPSISIVIKALNEEAKIGRCIESVLAALAEVEGSSEVILADSVSSDRTLEIARRYPITIVQLMNPSERGCGAGVQLGYQHSRGDYVMLLDGDMELLPGFLSMALARLASEPRLAGAAGLVKDTSIVNAFDRARVVSGASSRPERSARWLNGGGLYRRTAIVDVGGYAADRNLKAWEEAELGMRLRTAGWSLERIDFLSTLHTGHAASTFAILRSAWRSRRSMANGVLVKQAFGKPWMLKALALMLPPLLVILMWALALGVLGFGVASQRWELAAGYGLSVTACAVMLALYKRSLTQAMKTLGIWHYMAAALLAGLRDPILDPTARISSVNLSPSAAARVAFPSHRVEPKIERSIDSAAPLNLNSR